MNNYKQCETIISDIFDLKLGVGDIVEYKIIPFGKYQGIIGQKIQGKITYIMHRVAGVLGESTFEKILLEDLKLKQRNITLPMVLEAIPDVNISVATDGYFSLENPKKWKEMNITTPIKWQLRKDNQDCSLFDQKNEKLYKLIMEVLK